MHSADDDEIPPLPPPDEPEEELVPPLIPLAYSLPSTHRPRPTRPGFLSAIGVFSVLIGLIGLAADGLSLWILKGTPTKPAAGIARTAPTVTAKVANFTPLKVRPYDGDLIGAAGLKRADRDAVVLAVERVAGHPLAADRMIMAQRLLGEFGKNVFPQAPLTPQGLRSGIIEAGKLPAGPDGLRSLGTDFFRTNAGVVWLDDASAEFRATQDGSPTSNRGFTIQQDIATDDKGRVTQSAVAVGEQLDRLHTQFGPPFTAVQASVLAARLTATASVGKYKFSFNNMNRGNISPAPFVDDDPLYSMVGPALQVETTPRIWILADGRTIVNPRNLDPNTGLPAPPPGKTLSRPPPFALTRGTYIWGVVDASVAFVLAFALVGFGIAMLANHRSANRLHLGYAWLKLCAIALSAFATYLALSELHEAAVAPPEFIAAGAAVGLAFQAVLPVVILLVLRTSSASEYFESIGGTAGLVSRRLQRRVWPALRSAAGSGPGRAVIGSVALLATGSAVINLVAFLRIPGLATWPPTGPLHLTAALFCLAAALLCGRAVLETKHDQGVT